MTPSMKRSKAVIEDKREPRIRSLLDSLASRDPVVREKARESLVVVGKPAVPFAHSTSVASQTTRPMGSSKDAMRYRRSDCCHRAGECLG